MTNTAVENIPGIWDDARDIPFYRITARLFTPEFCLGASVLLANNDNKANAGEPRLPNAAPARPRRRASTRTPGPSVTSFPSQSAASADPHPPAPCQPQRRNTIRTAPGQRR